MVETLFVQLGGILVNISKVQAIKPSPTMPHQSLLFFGNNETMMVEISFDNVQRALAETYQQMAMMQAAANKAYAAQGGLH